MKESCLQKRILQYLKTVPGLWYYKANDRFTSGIPDVIGCLRGKFFGMEIKVGNRKVSKLQSLVMSLIVGAGGEAAVVRSFEDVVRFIREIKDGYSVENRF